MLCSNKNECCIATIAVAHLKLYKTLWWMPVFILPLPVQSSALGLLMRRIPICVIRGSPSAPRTIWTSGLGRQQPTFKLLQNYYLTQGKRQNGFSLLKINNENKCYCLFILPEEDQKRGDMIRAWIGFRWAGAAQGHSNSHVLILCNSKAGLVEAATVATRL